MNLLDVKNITVSFPSSASHFDAVRNLTFSMGHGQTVCLVGESGSGKSLTALAIMGLLPDTSTLSGTVSFEGNLVATPGSHTRGHRFCGAGMSMIFQEPTAALNPTMRIRDILLEALRFKKGLTGVAALSRAKEALHSAGIEDTQSVLEAYPWQLSGGLAQRAVIASALVLEPRLLIADEPSTALDVTTQARILQLLLKLRDNRGLSLLFITHDLTIAALLGGQTLVMVKGQAVERGATGPVLSSPRHPFTQTLIEATPGFALEEGRTHLSKVVSVEAAPNASSACPFYPRCPRRIARCLEIVDIHQDGDRTVACNAPLKGANR